jgi:HD superfamily phosphohydrolase YqeK
MTHNNTLWKKWVPILEKEVEKSLLKANPENRVGHGLDHMRRVWDICRKLGGQLGADLEILVAAAFLHDLGIHQKLSPEHGALSAELSAPVLERIRFPLVKRNKVLHAIRVHDVTFSNEDRHTVESRILYDADKTESFGVLGVLRYIIILYERRPIDYMLADLDKRWNGLCLPETKALSKPDYEYTRDYFQKLKRMTTRGYA